MEENNISYMCLVDHRVDINSVSFYGVEYKRINDKSVERTRKLSFYVDRLPIVSHIGPFSDEKEARDVSLIVQETFISKVQQKFITGCNYITKKMKESYATGAFTIDSLMIALLKDHSRQRNNPDDGECFSQTEYTINVHKESDTTEQQLINLLLYKKKRWGRGLPIAYSESPLAAGNWWIEIIATPTQYKNDYFWTDERFLIDEQIKNYLHTLEIDRTKVRPSFWRTDRSIRDTVLRLLSPYCIPGIFKSYSGTKAIKFVTKKVKGKELFEVKDLNWREFEESILDSQTEQERHRFDFKLDKSHGNPFIINVAVTTCVKDASVHLYTFDLSHNVIRGSPKILERASCKTLENFRHDVLIIGVPDNYMSAVESDIHKANKYGLSPYITHIDILMHLRNSFTRDSDFNLPYSEPQTNIASYFFVHAEKLTSKSPLGKLNEWSANMTDSFKIEKYIFELFYRARILGRPLSFGSQPFKNVKAGLSIRMEGIMTRDFIRAGYTVLPGIRERKSLDGGVNDPVKPQIIVPPMWIVNSDYVSFYGAIISAFDLDPSNKELWTTLYLKRKGTTQGSQQSSHIAGDLGTGDTRTQTNLLFDEWYNIMRKRNVKFQPVDKQNTEHPFSSTIRKIVEARQFFLDQGDMPSLTAFLKIASASYGTIAYENMRFQHTELSSMVTYLGRKIIHETSAFLVNQSGKNVSVIMSVTDSVALRVPDDSLNRVVANVEKFRKERLLPFFGDIFRFQIQKSKHLIMSKSNHYAMIDVDKPEEVIIKGYSPRIKSTPPIVTKAVKSFLFYFLTNNKINVWTSQDINDDRTLRQGDYARFQTAIRSSLKYMMEKTGITEDVPDSVNTRNSLSSGDYYVNWSEAEAKISKIYNYHPQDKDHVKTKEFITLERVCGNVVSYSKFTGYLISTNPDRKISQEAWLEFYLDFGIRREIIDIFNNIVPFTLIDECFRDIFQSMNPINRWDGKGKGNINGTIETGSSGSNSGRKHQMPALNASFWDKINNAACLDIGQEGKIDKTNVYNDVLLEEQEWVNAVLYDDLDDISIGSTSSSRSSSMPPPTTPKQIDVGYDQNETEEDFDAVMEKALADYQQKSPPPPPPNTTPSKNKNNRRKKKKKPSLANRTPKPRKIIMHDILPEYAWTFDIFCRSCKQSIRQTSLSKVESFLCPLCDKSIYGKLLLPIDDEMDIDDETKDKSISTELTGLSVNLVCSVFNLQTRIVEPYDYTNKNVPFALLKHNWLSLTKLRDTLLVECIQEREGGGNSGVTNKIPLNGTNALNVTDAESLLELELDSLLNKPDLNLRRRSVLSNFPQVFMNLNDQKTSKLKYLALVTQKLKDHPYSKLL